MRGGCGPRAYSHILGSIIPLPFKKQRDLDSQGVADRNASATCADDRRGASVATEVVGKWRLYGRPWFAIEALVLECSTMPDDVELQGSEEGPYWLTATKADLDSADLNAPADLRCADARALSRLYGDAGQGAAPASARAYAMLGAALSFQFKPNEAEEPFGPMARIGDRRTAQPSDFVGDPATALAAQIDGLKHPAVRARIADLVWLLDRKQATAAWSAISAYTELIMSVRAGTAAFGDHNRGIHSYQVAEHLRRAIQIAKAVGWDKEPAKAAQDLVAALRATAARESEVVSFRRLATLDLDYRISDPGAIAREVEPLAEAESDLHAKHALWHVAGRAHQRAKDQRNYERCLLAAAECLVLIADKADGSAMFEAHWLERAISEMHRVPKTKERRRVLKHRLVDVQSRIIDEMQHFTHTQDITEVVEATRTAVGEKPLMEAIRAFATLSVAPSPEQLEKDARAAIAEHPLSSLFPSTAYDSAGKPVHRDTGMEGSWEDGGVRRQITQAEKFRRSVTVQGQIEAARVKIISDHFIGEEVVGFICLHSPFVPPERTALFVSGIVHFFQGDMIAALHTLVPQLENSVRHVLRLRGHDVTKLNDDMTQEDLGFSVLLEKLRPELDAIFGSAMITDIDNVFNSRGGPNLRNRTAHGLISEWEPFGDDAIYACWLIFQLCCIPLLPKWQDLTAGFQNNS